MTVFSLAVIPAKYTQSPYPLQYYFELRSKDAATLYPALNATLSNHPYFAYINEHDVLQRR